jgi:hypothetical protein
VGSSNICNESRLYTSWLHNCVILNIGFMIGEMLQHGVMLIAASPGETKVGMSLIWAHKLCCSANNKQVKMLRNSPYSFFHLHE